MQQGANYCHSDDEMTDRHISWTNLQRLIESGAPARIRIPGQPRLDIMMETGGSALSLLVPISTVDSVPATRLEAIRVETIQIEGEGYARVTTRVRPLYQEFYLLLTEIADSIQLDGEKLGVAVCKRLESWKELLRSMGLLSAEQQIGLWGELWLLHRLLGIYGPPGLESWTGPLAEPHDFRFSRTEVEVKTTRNRQRTHIIAGLDQLTPSSGLRLFLLSLQLEPANTSDAMSLPRMVSSVREALASDAARQSSFEQTLRDACGYFATDEQTYGGQFRLRSQPALILVDNSFPQLTRETIRAAVGIDSGERILDVRYTVNVDNLGSVDGTPAFLEVIPAAKAIIEP